MNSHRPIAGFALCLLAGAALAQTTGQTTRPAAEIAVAGDGPTHVTGALSSKNVLLQEELFPNLTVTLLNVGHTISGQPERLAGKDGQIIGYLTEPLFPGPGRYRVNLPRLPAGPAVDLDNDGADDPGVRVFALRPPRTLPGIPISNRPISLAGCPPASPTWRPAASSRGGSSFTPRTTGRAFPWSAGRTVCGSRRTMASRGRPRAGFRAPRSSASTG